VRYVPYGPPNAEEPHVLAGGLAQPGTVLVLSNLAGSSTPAALLADTTAEMALRLLCSPRAPDLTAGAIAVTSERCDADSLLTVWALLNPEEALAHSEQVDEAARAGRYGVRRSAEAAQFACWVNGFRTDEGLSDEADAFRAMVPLVLTALDHPREFDLSWIGEYSDLIHDSAMLNSGAVQIEEYPELDLAIMETPLRLHDMVRLSAVSGFRLLTVRSENTFTLEYRLESWVQYQSRRPMPRIDLRPLATRLNMFERYAGSWRAEPHTEPRPRLFFDDGGGRPSPSALDAETVIAEVLDFFRSYARRHELQWSPYGPVPA
jgi:hypothetical protein